MPTKLPLGKCDALGRMGAKQLNTLTPKVGSNSTNMTAISHLHASPLAPINSCTLKSKYRAVSRRAFSEKLLRGI